MKIIRTSRGTDHLVRLYSHINILWEFGTNMQECNKISPNKSNRVTLIELVFKTL